MLGLPASGPSHNLGAPLRAVREDIEREWAGRLAAEEAKRKEANEWATELAHVLEKEKKVCPLAVSKKCSQEQGMGMDLYNSSPVARAIWDSADAHLISAYGFSIVQENPKKKTIHFDGIKGQAIRERLNVQLYGNDL